MGVSTSGEFGYVAGEGGHIDIRHLSDGTFAGSKDIASESPLSGIFVDPANSEVWLIKPDRTIEVHAAAIAIDSTGSDGPVDGAPDFDTIYAGKFCRIVLSDSRNLAPPPKDHPKSGDLLSVVHRNQFGRYVDGKWREWPASVINGRSYQLKGSNCVPSAAAMALDRHTHGRVRITPPDMREYMRDTSGETNLVQVKAAWNRIGPGYTFNYEYDGRFSQLMERLREGRGVVVLGDFHGIPPKYKCQSGYVGEHGLYLHRVTRDGRIEVHDPLCRSGARYIPVVHVRKYCSVYSNNREGWADYGWTSDTTKTPGAATQKSRSFFVVWSEGTYVNELVSGGVGQPLSQTRRWEPGDQKSGFLSGSKVTVQAPDIVIRGEEARVNEWDPVTMGYGRKYSDDDRAYYRAKGGSVDSAVYSIGWNLVPWDIPVSTFSGPPPPWPQGEAYLAQMLAKFNREQGTQVLGIVNRGNIWTQIRLGGRYTLQVSLQGPYPAGLTGEIRVVAFSPDEQSGVLQIQAEWLG